MSDRGHDPECDNRSRFDLFDGEFYCAGCGGRHVGDYDGGLRWAVVQRLDPEPRVVPMDSEKQARQFYKSWTEFASTKAFPNNPERWPQLARTQIKWSVVSVKGTKP